MIKLKELLSKGKLTEAKVSKNKLTKELLNLKFMGAKPLSRYQVGEIIDLLYQHKLVEGKVNEDYSQRARNFRVNLRTRLKAMKNMETVGIGKMIFSKMVDGNFQITKTGKVFGLEDVVQAIQKGPARPYIKTHRGAAGAVMVNAYVKFGR